MGRWLFVALLISACGFESRMAPGAGDAGVQGDAPPIPDGPPRPDGAVSAPDPVVHVGADDAYLGLADLVIGADATIDTTTMAISAALPAGVTFAAAQQAGGGPELAILHVAHLGLEANVRVTGTRPFVVIADSVSISAAIDATGHHSEPGAGATTAGAGAVGGHNGTYDDSGAGGGAHATAGASGGDTTCAGCPGNRLDGGAPGSPYNLDGAQLIGGGPGGRSYAAPVTACDTRAPGAGGGAVEIYARTQIEISGDVNAGGGGGLGGDQCGTPYNWLAGHGGGAGGMIVLQSPVVRVSGRLSANGGGGGAGAGNSGDGGDGEDGGTGPTAARGGTASAQYSAAGGDGAAEGHAAKPGGNAPASGNAGGGGGGLGRILLLYRAAVAPGTTSPKAVTATY